MTRLANVEKAGYFPTPPLVTQTANGGHHTIGSAVEHIEKYRRFRIDDAGWNRRRALPVAGAPGVIEPGRETQLATDRLHADGQMAHRPRRMLDEPARLVGPAGGGHPLQDGPQPTPLDLESVQDLVAHGSRL